MSLLGEEGREAGKAGGGTRSKDRKPGATRAAENHGQAATSAAATGHPTHALKNPDPAGYRAPLNVIRLKP